MRSLLTFMLAASMLPALSQAQTVNICDRTPQVRDAIMQALETDACAVDSEGLASIEFLNLSRQGITALQAGDFDGLTSLQELGLDGNQLTALPDGAFDGLTSLQALYLYGNQLTALPDGAFDGLTSLQTLYLSGNQLTTLPDGAFDGLTSLQTLALFENQLTALPDGAFADLTSLQTLYLSGNQLTTLPDGAFDGLTSLQTLALSENQLTALPDGAFDGLTSLQTLALSENQLTALPDGAFDGLTSLQTLALSENQLTALPDGAFDGLTSLQTLALFENQLTALPDGAFADLTSLQTLYLSGNQLTTLPDGAFDGLTSLQTLALSENQLTALPDGAFDGLTSLQTLALSENQLTALPDGAFDGLTSLQTLALSENQLTTLPDGAFDGLTSLQELHLFDNQLTALPDDLFDGLTSLQFLWLNGNQLAALPDGAFDGLPSLQELHLFDNQLTALPDGLFDGLTSLQGLYLIGNQLTALPDGLFDGLTSLQGLYLSGNQLTALPDGLFDGLTSLQILYLSGNQLTALPDGLFDGLTSLQILYLSGNQSTALPDGLFDGLTSLQALALDDNQLAALPDGLFDGLTSLQTLALDDNQLAALPDGLFDGLTSLQALWLQGNYLMGLARTDPALAGIPSEVQLRLGGQTEPGRIAAAVPLMVSASDSMRQGFVRIINASDESGNFRILAFDDAGNAAEPIEVELGASQAMHFNSNDLEQGNASKGINAGVGSPQQGDWRLDIETALAVRVLSYVRTTDGFLTAMHHTTPRTTEGGPLVRIFNPAGNNTSVSKLRLVNTGGNVESLSIEGVDDQGNMAGPVTLTLAAGESRTLSASNLENGAQGLTGTLGEGAGKWRLSIAGGDTVDSVIGVSLLDSASGHLSNLSTDNLYPSVPLMLSASDSMRQGFMRIINNESDESGGLRIVAVDDGGNAAEPFVIQLGASQAMHFNSNDLEQGNASKGINAGVGSPEQGDWRFRWLFWGGFFDIVGLSYVRTTDGFLTAMHDRLPRDDGRLVAQTFNPGSNMNQESKLRLVNTGGNVESLSIDGVDDQGNMAGPVTLTLAAGEARTLSASDLENGAQGLTGMLGDGAGKWRLFITAGQAVEGMSLLEAVSGHLTNISTMGVATEGQ